jgi:hypothetical protein
MREAVLDELCVRANSLLLFVGFLVIGVQLPGHAQDLYVMPRINGAVTLDGLSDEAAWDAIEPLPVVMFMPRFGGEPTERTDILLAYDDNFLYLAGRLYDQEPSGVQYNSRTRDSDDPSSDWFGIVIDSFNDKQTAVAFFTTPAGLRWDAAVINDAQGVEPLNVEWDSFWDVASVRSDEGWFVEFRIPFSSLRFQDSDGRVVMGIITWRKVARKNEQAIFPSIPPDWGFFSCFKPSQAQEFVLDGVYSRRPLYTAPYTLIGLGRSSELNEAETAYERQEQVQREIGLEVKYGLTSNLTLDVTVNPDFAQVEADDQQINLTRFSLFFPEKRPFFQERSANFDFTFIGPNRLFYSRRIGMCGEDLTRVYGGARLVGRVGSWDLGVLNMQTAACQDTASQNYGILRLRRQVFDPYSYVGGILATKIGTDGTYNIAYGLDGLVRAFGQDYLTVKWAQSYDSGDQRQLFSPGAARAHVNWERRTTRGLSYFVGSSYVGPGYKPGIGFEAREDYTSFSSKVMYGWFPDGASPLFFHGLFLDGFVIFGNRDGAIESAEVGPGWTYESRSDYSGTISPRVYREDILEAFELSDDVEVPPGRYTFWGLSADVRTPGTRRMRASLNVEAGSFYDGWRVSLGLSPWWSLGAVAELSGSYEFTNVDFSKRDTRFVVHVGRLRILYMPSTRFSGAAFIQYNSAIDAVIVNVRLRYNPREGIDVYFVYDETVNTDPYGHHPVAPTSANRTAMLKFRYTLAL